MRKILIAAFGLAVAAAPALAQGQHQVRGYTRQDGTYVAPHMQTNPDNNVNNNWSTRGNTNPYTGQPGTVDPYRAQTRSSYGSSTDSSDDQ